MTSAFYPQLCKKSLSQETGRQPNFTEKENQASKVTMTCSRSHGQGIAQLMLSPTPWAPKLVLSIVNSVEDL